MKNVDAVVVAYNPDPDVFKRCLISVASQVRFVWVFDNSPSESASRIIDDSIDNAFVFSQGENIGIAAAQNVAISKAVSNGAEYVVILDHDTVLPSSYRKSMLDVFRTNKDVAAVAPLFRNLNNANDNEGFDVNSIFGYKRFYPESEVRDVCHAISSGLFVDCSALKSVGLMDEALFIDWVDFEWCWRARSHGLRIVGNANVIIDHYLGDESINFLGKDIGLRSPLRHYYITRNAFYLSFYCPNIDFLHRVFLLYKGSKYIAGYTLLKKPRLKNLKMTLTGMLHGLSAKMGRYNG